MICAVQLHMKTYNVGMDTASGSPGKDTHWKEVQVQTRSNCVVPNAIPGFLKELTTRLEIPISPVHPYSFSTFLSPSSSLLSAPFTSLFRRV